MPDHDGISPWKFYVTGSDDAGVFLCCPANNCTWGKELGPWTASSSLDVLAELAKQHLEDTR